MLFPDFVAQSLPPTVKYLNRPPEFTLLVVVTPFVAVEAPLRVMSVTPPDPALKPPILSKRLCPFGVITIEPAPPKFAPFANCIEPNVWLLSWVALPTRFRVPPLLVIWS